MTGSAPSRLRARLVVGGYPLVAVGWIVGFVARLGRASAVGAVLFVVGLLLTSLRAEQRHSLSPRQLSSLADAAELPPGTVMLTVYTSMCVLLLAATTGVIMLLSP